MVAALIMKLQLMVNFVKVCVKVIFLYIVNSQFYLFLQVVACYHHSDVVLITLTKLVDLILRAADATIHHTAAALTENRQLKGKTMKVAVVSTHRMDVALMRLLPQLVTATQDALAMLISSDAVQMVLRLRPVHTIKVRLRY